MSSFDKDESHHRESNDGQDKEPILHILPAGTSKMAKSTNGPAIDRSEVYSTLRSVFGHDDLRDGQEWAINRCLDRKRTLLVAPTGFGKSLCYALPATLMDGICVVVTPLLSLIQVCFAVFFKLSDQHQAHSHIFFWLLSDIRTNFDHCLLRYLQLHFRVHYRQLRRQRSLMMLSATESRFSSFLLNDLRVLRFADYSALNGTMN